MYKLILAIENVRLRLDLSALLAGRGFEVLEAADGYRVKKLLNEQEARDVSVLVMEDDLPGFGLVEILRHAEIKKKSLSQLKIIVLSGREKGETFRQCPFNLQKRVSVFVRKSGGMSELTSVLLGAVHQVMPLPC